MKLFMCRYRFWLLLPVYLFALGLQAAELKIHKKMVTLNDSRTTGETTLSLQLASPDDVHITVKSAGSTGDTQTFYMTPEQADTPGKVAFAMALPYHQQVKGALKNKASENRVRNNYQQSASHAFSSCPSARKVNTGKICKPLSFRVVDDEEAVPGIFYSARVDVLVETHNGKKFTEQVIIRYRKKGSAIHVVTRKKEFNLVQSKNYSDTARFCVFSRFYSKFQVRLESDKVKAHKRILTDNQGRTLPYKVDATLNTPNQKKAYPNIKSGVWLSGGEAIKSEKKAGCAGEKHLVVTVHIDEKDVSAAMPGIYDGVLTLRVKAI